MLDAIPVFKPNQALTADHLNDLREFLDQQDRLTRRALIGIGVMCGFDLDVDANGQISIGKGVAVTSDGHVIADQAVDCNRYRPYTQPLPSGDDVTPQMLAEARYPYLFLNGANQIAAWELLTIGTTVPDEEPQPSTLTPAFLNGKCVMLFLECTEEALRNCSINDCSDKGAELQFTLRRLLVNRADADAMLAEEARVAGRPVDPASHPGLGLPYLRVEDLGMAREGIATFPALFARILEIAMRLAADLPDALKDTWNAYGYLMEDMYPVTLYPNGPFPSEYFGNVWGNLFTEPYLVQYFYDYLLDVSSAYNEFVAAARGYHAECLPDPLRFPKHVLLGDPLAAPRGFVAAVATPAEFAVYDPLAASSGFGPRPNPPQRRTPWIPASKPPQLDDLRALFHRLTLLAHAYQLRGMLNAEIRITPSRHDAALLGERAIPPYYAVNRQADLFRVWSPEKTRSNLLSTVYAYPFSQRTAEHPYLYRIDGEDFYAIAGHVGKDLSTAMRELIVHKRVLGLDFAIEPVWMGLGMADNSQTAVIDKQNQARALEAVKRLILCRMSDVEVILLGILAALFAFLVFIYRGIARQMTLDHAKAPMTMTYHMVSGTEEPSRGTSAGVEIAAEDMARLVRMARIDALRRPDNFAFTAARLTIEERREINQVSEELLGRFRKDNFTKGEAINKFVSDGDGTTIGGLYKRVQTQTDNSNLFDRVRLEVTGLNIANEQQEAAADRVYKAVSLMDATEDLMGMASSRSLADFDAQGFETAFNTFSDRMTVYAETAPSDKAATSQDTARTNIAIADYAPSVAAQTTTFSKSGFFGEIGRRMRNIFLDLTMQGFALKHPGLEHRGGVPKGGTLVLAYASKQEFLTLMRLAATRLDNLKQALALGGGGLAAVIEQATAELLAAAGPTRNDPLSDFVVLADFCISSQCCDSDCSDVAFEDDLPTDLFNLDLTGHMAVDPIVPNGSPTAPQAGGVGVNSTASEILNSIGVGRTGRHILDSGIAGRTVETPAHNPGSGSAPGRPSQPSEQPRPIEVEPEQPPERPSRPSEQPNRPTDPPTGRGGVRKRPTINRPRGRLRNAPRQPTDTDKE